jgi:hypothetical protein
MTNSVEDWERFTAAAEKHMRRGKTALRTFIRGADPIVRDQLAWRAEHPGFPRSAGAAEAVFEDLKRAFYSRSGRFRNAKRLDLVLGLIRLHELDLAQPHILAGVIRTHVETHGGVASVDWNAILDREASMTGHSLDRLIWEAGLRQAQRRQTAAARANKVRDDRAVERRASERAAQGLPPAVRPRRTTPKAYVPIARGTKVAEVPHLVARWHPTKNDRDPATTAATMAIRVWFICRAHEQDPERPHLHEWETSLKDQASKPTDCPFCMHRRACPSNSLAVTDPDVAAEWHPTKNGDLRPEDVLRSANRDVWWRCALDKRHVWQARIDSRTRGSGCPKHRAVEADRARREKRREYEANKRVMSRLAPLYLDEDERVEAGDEPAAIDPDESADQDDDYEARIAPVLRRQPPHPARKTMLTPSQLNEDGF